MTSLWRGPRAHWIFLVVILMTLFAMLTLHTFASSDHFAGAAPDRCGKLLPPVPRTPGAEGAGRPIEGSTLSLAIVGGPDPRTTPEILHTLRSHHLKAAFFVTGAQVNMHPGLARAILAEGHDIGLCTFTGRDPAELSSICRGIELAWSRFSVAAATHYDTQLWYSPVVARDLRSDLEVPADLLVQTRSPAHQVLLLAGAGPSAMATTAVIRQLAAPGAGPGYRFATLSSSFEGVPEKATATALQIAYGNTMRWRQRAAVRIDAILRSILELFALLGLIRMALQVGGAMEHVRRRNRVARDRSRTPARRETARFAVSVLVPAYNESAGIEATVRSLLASTHPVVQIVVIDDGSTDDTADIVMSIRHPQVFLIRQANSGKPAALNTGIRYASHDIIIMVDGDTVFGPETITRLIEPFADPAVGAISGNTKVGNRRSMLARWQHLEYVTGFNLNRRMFQVAECMTTVPGAIGAFRRKALNDVGGLSGETLAEDTDLTMAIYRAGWQICYQDRALAWTEVPITFGQLWRQRYRWSYGTLQAMWKHREAFLERTPGAPGRHRVVRVGWGGRLGRRGLIFMIVFDVVVPLMWPLLVVVLLQETVFSGLTTDPVLPLAAIAMDLVVTGVALRLDDESLRSLWALPLQRLVYSQFASLIVIHTLVTATLGIQLKWQRMHRMGTATNAVGT